MRNITKTAWLWLPALGALSACASPAAPSGPSPARHALGSSADAGTQSIGVPAYIDNTLFPQDWQRIFTAASTASTVIVNFGTPGGPGTAPSVANAQLIRDARANGITVLGYVDTSYFALPSGWKPGLPTDPKKPAEWDTRIREQVGQWYDWYGSAGLSGIFFDQAWNDCSAVTWYTGVHDAVVARDANALVVTNQGQYTPDCYLAAADVLLTFEASYAEYTRWTVPSTPEYAWMRDPANAARQWHLVYDACPIASTPDCAAVVRDAVARSKGRNAGILYVTTYDLSGRPGGDPSVPPIGSPWGRLTPEPSWSDEIAAVNAASP